MNSNKNIIALNEAIETWLNEWHLCEMCEIYHYRQITCNCEASKTKAEFKEG